MRITKDMKLLLPGKALTDLHPTQGEQKMPWPIHAIETNRSLDLNADLFNPEN